MSETREEIEETARPAVLVRRSDLPVPLAHDARSFIGGLPRLPPELEWPMAEVATDDSNETVALTFVAQIDLSELPVGDWSPFPKQGTLFFFCSTMFVGEANPPCNVFYSSARGDAFPQREPPPDLMRLGGEEEGRAELYSTDDFYSKAEFKYPLSFRPYRDFLFDGGFLDEHRQHPGNVLKIEQLVKALGAPELSIRDILQFRPFPEYVEDPLWPFNWLLIGFVARSISDTAEKQLAQTYDPLSNAAAIEFKRILSEASGWIEQSRSQAPLSPVAADAKSSFRLWWMTVHRIFAERRCGSLRNDLEEAINQAIRHAVVDDSDAVASIPRIYLENLRRRNQFARPNPAEGLNDYRIAVHQMLGNGSGPQDARDQHEDDILLLQLSGDPGLHRWHSDIGCVLHFWIDRELLDRLDFSEVVATLECD